MNTTLLFRLATHDDRRVRLQTHDITVTPNTDTRTEFAGARWLLRLDLKETAPGVRLARFTATIEEGCAEQVAAGLVWSCKPWSVENYVLIPGAAYAGNRFDAKRRPYPPKIRDIGQRPGELRLDIGDIPRLSDRPGRSHLDQTSLDAATPALGVRCAATRSALLLLTPRTSGGHAIGLEVMESEARDSAELILLCPGFLHPFGEDDPMGSIGNQTAGHRHPENPRPATLRAGESLGFAFEWHEFPCPDVHALFDRLFEHRTAMFPEVSRPLPDILPFSEAWRFLEKKHNAQNWNEAAGLYQVGIPWSADKHCDQPSQFWQNGWCGGGIAAFAFDHSGEEIASERATRNLDFLLTQGIGSSGLFKAVMSSKGVWKGDGSGMGGEGQSWVLTRRQGDTLFFVLRHFLLRQKRGQSLQPAWLDAARRCANTLCDIWEREGSFGFLMDYEKGCVAIHGSTSGALIPAALVHASEFFDEPRFLAVARAAAAHCRDHDLAWGVTTGGPGDALQAPDGESIFGLIESFIALHHATRESGWLEAAVHACHQAASWTISFPVVFPSGSALAEVGMDARGTMVANAQNKCGVPGICTLSGDGVFKTFRATGDVRLLDLIREIAHSLPQFVSRPDRPIPTRITWGHPLPTLPEGWMCERVNITPSWPEPLGEQAAYSCWCEVAMMLTWCELPGIYAQPDTGLIRCLDHVQAEWSDATRTALRISNPTAFPARVRVMIETSAATAQALSPNFADHLPITEIPPGQDARFPLLNTA